MTAYSHFNGLSRLLRTQRYAHACSVMLLVAVMTSATTAQVVTPSPIPSASPRFSDTGIVGGSPTVAPQPAPTPSGANTEQHGTQFVGTWDVAMDVPGGSKVLGSITLNEDGTYQTDIPLLLPNATTKEKMQEQSKSVAADWAKQGVAYSMPRWEVRWKTAGNTLTLTNAFEVRQAGPRNYYLNMLVTSEHDFHPDGAAGSPANRLSSVNGQIKVVNDTDNPSVQRNLESVRPVALVMTRRATPAIDASEVAKAELTPSPTATPKPTGTNTPDGRQALKDALRRDPEYAKMSEKELDAFVDELDHDRLATWGVSDAMKAEMEWYTSRGLSPSDPVIKAATPDPTPEPTPAAVIQNPYDWVTHARQESDLDNAIRQLHDKMKDAADAHEEFDREKTEPLRRQLEILRHVRNQAMRNPTRYMPRLPPRR